MYFCMHFVFFLFYNFVGSVINFNKYSENELHMFNQTYDYESVMHYGPHDFAENKSKPTIVPIKKGVKIGQRKGFSEKDLIKINLLYNCTGAGKLISFFNHFII